jgi:hypothetical protein
MGMPLTTKESVEYDRIIRRRIEQLGWNNPYARSLPEDIPNSEAGLWFPSKLVPEGAEIPKDFDNPPRGLLRLHPDDVIEAIGGADRLRRDALKQGAQERYGCTEGDQKQRIGALGEVALARALGVPWEKKSRTYGRAPGQDVAGWAVRTRNCLGALCLQPELKDLLAPFMLIQVVHWPHLVNIAGWIWGVDGHQDPWYGLKSSGDGLFWVPAYRLHDQHFIHPKHRHEFEGGPRKEAGREYATFTQ